MDEKNCGMDSMREAERKMAVRRKWKDKTDKEYNEMCLTKHTSSSVLQYRKIMYVDR